MCCPGIHECIRDDDTNRETTGEGPGAERADQRRMGELRVEVVVKESLNKTQKEWELKMAKRADAQKVECKRR